MSKKIFIILSLLIIVFAFSGFGCKEEEVIPSQETKPQVTETEAGKQTSTVLSLAEKFAEAYGTFTNRDKFTNITDLYSYMTDEMKPAKERFVEQSLEHQDPKAPFYGITTKVLASKILWQDDSECGVLVVTRREETTSQENKKRYQNILIEVEKINNEWKVNMATWQ